ncbi:MAG: hypothetical protein CL840_11640 [Crocinitomicaceae bacterium]|nr:hypothetical protein [Crocinitomicaceae bacterium]
MFFLLVAIWFVAIPLANLGTSHLRIIEAINTDEGDLLWLMIQAYRNGNFDLGSSPYGILYYNTCLILTYMLGWFTQVTDTHMIVITRLVSFFALIGTSTVVAKYAHRFKMGQWGLVFILTLLGSQVAIRYGLMLHPDMLQVFFIALGLYCIASYMEQAKPKWILLAMVMAGLAFSSKYSGLILLPLIGIALLLKYKMYYKTIPLNVIRAVNIIGSALIFTSIQLLYASSFAPSITEVGWLSFVLTVGTIISVFVFVFHVALIFNQRLFQNEWIRFLAIKVFLAFVIGFVFGLTFCFAAPQGIIDLQFFSSFLAMTNEHVDGFWFRESSGFIGWVEELLKPNVLKLFWFILACFGLIWALLKGQIRLNNWLVPKLIPAYWIVLYFAVLTFGVNSKFPHYLLPVLPFLFLYAGYVLSQTIELLRAKLAENKLELIHFAVFGILGVILSYQALNYRNTEVAKFQNSPRIAIGEWMDENIQEEIFILADKYIYIPPRQRFKALTLWGISSQVIEETNPDYLAIQYDIYSQFLDINRVDEYLHGRELYLDRNQLYTKLINNTHPGYELVKDLGENKLYRRREAN